MINQLILELSVKNRHHTQYNEINSVSGNQFATFTAMLNFRGQVCNISKMKGSLVQVDKLLACNSNISLPFIDSANTSDGKYFLN